MSECDSTNFQISLILQIVTVVLTTVSTIMLGMRCKCKGPCGEINLRPRSSPFTPPDMTARPVAEAERHPLVAAAAVEKSDAVVDVTDSEK